MSLLKSIKVAALTGLCYLALSSCDGKTANDSIAKREAETQKYSVLESRLGNVASVDETNNIEHDTSPTPVKKTTKIKSLTEYINQYVNEFNDKLKPTKPLDPRLIMAMQLVETGDGYASKYDPMQISNEGDYALRVLAEGKDGTSLLGDFSDFKDIKNAQISNGRWNYTNTKIDVERSIRGGIAWLFHKAAIYDYHDVEEGDMLKYKVKKGDSFSKIAKKNGTTIKTLKKYNPKVKPESLQIGQEISYKEAKTKQYISRWGDWKDAVKNYNGGGDPDYLDKVIKNYLLLESTGQILK